MLSVFGANYDSLNDNTQAQKIAAVVPRYEEIQNEAWDTLSTENVLQRGMNSSLVPEIRRRLIILGDLVSDGSLASSSKFDGALSEAVKHFQWRHGLQIDGIIGAATLRNLNISPAQRLQQLNANYQRWLQLPTQLPNEYVWINVPDYHLDVIENGVRVLSMKTIVGRPERPTPELRSRINTIVLNPTWNVPNIIIKQDMIPKILNNPDYLAANNLRVYSSWNNNAKEINSSKINWAGLQNQLKFPYRITQDPGPRNALGQVKFVFQNNEDVYMHDTPEKQLFDLNVRAKSSGCIRVEQPFQLMEYFLTRNSKISPSQAYQQLSNGRTKFLPLSTTIPIYITYFTAWVDPNGWVNFRDDIYQRDYAN